jgi:hypothetical protein
MVGSIIWALAWLNVAAVRSEKNLEFGCLREDWLILPFVVDLIS